MTQNNNLLQAAVPGNSALSYSSSVDTEVTVKRNYKSQWTLVESTPTYRKWKTKSSPLGFEAYLIVSIKKLENCFLNMDDLKINTKNYPYDKSGRQFMVKVINLIPFTNADGTEFIVPTESHVVNKVPYCPLLTDAMIFEAFSNNIGCFWDTAAMSTVFTELTKGNLDCVLQ